MKGLRSTVAESQRDFYEVLGVERDADAKTIKRAFLKKARVLHPDVSDDPDAVMALPTARRALAAWMTSLAAAST